MHRIGPRHRDGSPDHSYGDTAPVVRLAAHRRPLKVPQPGRLVLDDPDWVVALHDWFDEISGIRQAATPTCDVRYDNLDEIGSRLP